MVFMIYKFIVVLVSLLCEMRDLTVLGSLDESIRETYWQRGL